MEGIPRHRSVSSPLLASLMVLLLLGRAWAAEGGTPPADALLLLLPGDTAVALTVENLRDNTRMFLASTLAAELRQLPAVQAWFESEKYKQLERSRAQIEEFVGANLTELRDELLGDALVLALWLPADAPPNPSAARGILLFQARDRALLERVIRMFNTAQQDSGELARVADRRRGTTTYHVREFPADSGRPAEWYVTYPDGTCAFSNSESLIHGVIDRKSQKEADGAKARRAAHASGPVAGTEPSLGRLPRLKSVRSKLPEQALARLFIDPRQLQRVITAAPQPNKPADHRIPDMLVRYISAVDYAGAALVWSDRGIALYTVETLDAPTLDPWIRRWAGDPRQSDPALRRIPQNALALASTHIDAVACHDALRLLVPDRDQVGLSNLETVLTGLLLGEDLRTRILPNLGPGVVAYIDSPPATEKSAPNGLAKDVRTWPCPLVLVISLERGAGKPAPGGVRTQTATASVSVADALENALRTLLALAALDRNRNQGHSRITTRVVARTTVTTLDAASPLAYAVDRAGGRLILSTSADAVARYLESSLDSKAGDRFRRLQSVSRSDGATFFCVDLDAFNRLAGAYRDRLVQNLAARQGRPTAQVERDLDHLLALAQLFDAAYLTHRIDPKATVLERTIGLLRRERSTASVAKP